LRARPLVTKFRIGALVRRTVVCRADSMQAKPGKTLKMGDSYKVVDSRNSSAFVLIGEVLMSCLLVVLLSRMV